MRRVLGCALVVLTICATRVRAQYYEEKEYSPSEARYISLGAVDVKFSPRYSNTQPESLMIRFKRTMPVVSFKHGGAEVLFGYTTYPLLGGSRSAIYFGGKFESEVPIVGRKPGALLFPLLVSADFTKAESAGPSRDDFNLASIGIGGGLKFRYIGSSIDFSIGVEEVAQYSSEGFGVGSGFSASTLGDAVMLLKDISLLEGIAIGYRFRLQTWSMNETRFNYKSTLHGPYLGVMF